MGLWHKSSAYWKDSTHIQLNAFPNVKFQTLPNWKSLQTTVLDCNENGRELSSQIENTVGKGEIAPFPSVFRRLVLQTCNNQGLFGKGLTWLFSSTFQIHFWLAVTFLTLSLWHEACSWMTQAEKQEDIILEIFGFFFFSSANQFIIVENYFQYVYMFNSLPNKPWFLRVCSMSLLKTVWE